MVFLAYSQLYSVHPGTHGYQLGSIGQICTWQRPCFVFRNSRTHGFQHGAGRAGSRNVQLWNVQRGVRTLLWNRRDDLIFHDRIAFWGPLWQELGKPTFAGYTFDTLEVLQLDEFMLCVCTAEKLTLTVFTCSSRVASSSTTIMGCGCDCRLERVHM